MSDNSNQWKELLNAIRQLHLAGFTRQQIIDACEDFTVMVKDGK